MSQKIFAFKPKNVAFKPKNKKIRLRIVLCIFLTL